MNIPTTVLQSIQGDSRKPSTSQRPGVRYERDNNYSWPERGWKVKLCQMFEVLGLEINTKGTRK